LFLASFAIIWVSLFCISCSRGPDIEILKLKVESSIKEEYAQKPETKNIRVNAVELISKGRNEYIGYVDIELGGETARRDLEVIVSGDKMIWKIK
jgi:hypothetical protein